MEQIDWPGIRANAVTMGIRAAARAAAVRLSPEDARRFEDRVRKRAEREGWEEKRLAASQPARQSASYAVANVANGQEAALSALADDERESRLSLSRTVLRLARKSETADIPIESTADLHSLAKTYAVTHRIEQQTTPGLVLNLFGVTGEMKQVRDVEPKTIDVEPA